MFLFDLQIAYSGRTLPTQGENRNLYKLKVFPWGPSGGGGGIVYAATAKAKITSSNTVLR